MPAFPPESGDALQPDRNGPSLPGGGLLPQPMARNSHSGRTPLQRTASASTLRARSTRFPGAAVPETASNAHTPRPPLGAILVGGRSRRFGSAKHLADLGGRPLLRWVVDAVGEVLPEPVLLTGDAESVAGIGESTLPDRMPGSGPLGGIHAALLHAEATRRPGALCVACDTPFLPPGLLRFLVERFANSAADVVAAESDGPLGLEPLCAVYRTSCLPVIEARLDAGEHALGGLIRALTTDIVPLKEVERFGDPGILFLNVNTPEQHARAIEAAGLPNNP